MPLVDDVLYQSAIVGHTLLVRLDDDWIGVGQCTYVPRKRSYLVEPRLSDLSSWGGMSSPKVPFQSDRIMQELSACRSKDPQGTNCWRIWR